MTWQDELQKLDLELASGRISADDYRRRRDEVLAASSAAAPQPQQQGPFAPPFKWDATPPQQQSPNPDATQVVSSGQPQQSNPDATQVVSGQRPADADRTQYVRPVSGPIPAQQMPPQQGGWQSTPPQTAPPWGGGDGFTPISDPSPAWIAQGPEVFDEKGGGKGKIFAIIGVVLVLALIGGGIWWFASGSKKDNPPVGQSTSQSAPTTTTTKPKDDLEIAEIPGGKKDPSSIKAWTDLVEGKLLANEENAAYEAGTPTKARLASAKLPNDISVQIITVEMASPEAAKKAVEDLVAAQTKFGLQNYSGTCPTSVLCQTLAPAADKKGNIRAHYVHKNTVARVQVVGKDATEMNKVFEELIAAQIEALSVDA
ncbi:flagellar basal body protein FliL [Lentzea tibetensis]|uniref:Flagellar basal body protein FliL n=1 Tax=Lentzea tibetensis TaxID=2591470 RepID=A0A563EZ24_9PSEU|nr:flagellar basal body protein FliL [Lentzea tibetensis]TWP52792.1 flagellar basal body protein FliL [Lentzea tibetensis]